MKTAILMMMMMIIEPILDWTIGKDDSIDWMNLQKGIFMYKVYSKKSFAQNDYEKKSEPRKTGKKEKEVFNKWRKIVQFT